MDIRQKMIPAFRNAQGGLFTCVEKADVGSSYQELAKKGYTLMGWADPFMPDFSLSKHILDATIEAVNENISPHYTVPIGNPELKKALADKLLMINHLDVDPERNILITPGSDSGLYFAMLPFLNEGDEVIVPCPSYPNNMLNASIMGAVPRPMLLKAENGFQFSLEDLEKQYSPKTKMVVLTHPNNPTTTIFNKQSLKALADFVINHDLILVCDQAFEDFCYSGKLITPASLPGMFERTVTVFSFSKGMGLSGYRVGYLVCSDAIMDTMYANAVTVMGAAHTVSQLAVLAALKDPSFMDEFRHAFDIRRKAAFDILNTVPGVSMLLPESGFLAWVDVHELGNSSEIAAYLLRKVRISVNDGINYGPGDEGYLRIVLGVYRDNQRVIRALEDIRDALLEFKK